jgi:hypothetical protein
VKQVFRSSRGVLGVSHLLDVVAVTPVQLLELLREALEELVTPSRRGQIAAVLKYATGAVHDADDAHDVGLMAAVLREMEFDHHQAPPTWSTGRRAVPYCQRRRSAAQR